MMSLTMEYGTGFSKISPQVMTRFTVDLHTGAWPYRKVKWVTPVWFDVKEAEKPSHLKNSPLPQVGIYRSLNIYKDALYLPL